MKLTKIAAFVAALIVLDGCTTISRTKDLSDTIYPDAASASMGASPLLDIEHGKRFITIAVDDDMSPSIRRGKSARDYFESVRVRGNKGQHFHLVVAATVDFLGFSKTAILPQAKLYDSKGELITEGKRERNPMVVELRGTFPHSGIYRLLVIADSTHEGETIGTVYGVSPGGAIRFPVGVEASNEGQVQVSWSGR